VVYHLRDSAILSGHKEWVYADESVVAVVVSSGTCGVFYAKAKLPPLKLQLLTVEETATENNHLL
jgi:hypothetical protein